MRQSGGHFYRRVGLRGLKIAIAGVLVFTPFYPVDAVYSPSKPTVFGSASPANISKQQEAAKQKQSQKKAAEPATVSPITPVSCNYSPMRTLPGGASSQLVHMYDYERLCGGALFDSLSFFIATPTSTSEARESANYIAGKLKQFKAADIQPVVYMEPTSPSGLIDLKKLAAGTYDAPINALFTNLKAAGISDRDMGMWVPIPEGNIPVWTNLEPSVFGQAFSRIAKAQKAVFPSSKTSVLLDTMTYPTNGVWSGGRAISLLPYMKAISPGLVDSVGLQGFPWVSPANQGAVDNGGVSDFLKPSLAAEAARYARINDVWINSGTYAQKYTSSAQKVSLSAQKRQTQLDGIVAAAAQLKQQGFTTSVHLFAENKLGVGEQTNWSYLPSSTSRDHQAIFTGFAAKLHTAGVGLWLYDS